eukprot:872776-Amphidinium_carterae.1
MEHVQQARFFSHGQAHRGSLNSCVTKTSTPEPEQIPISEHDTSGPVSCLPHQAENEHKMGWKLFRCNSLEVPLPPLPGPLSPLGEARPSADGRRAPKPIPG